MVAEVNPNQVPTIPPNYVHKKYREIIREVFKIENQDCKLGPWDPYLHQVKNIE